MSDIKKLADLHERDIAEWFGGSMTKGSGNQFNGQGDGALSRFTHEMGWTWDCKCALPGTKSIGVTRDMAEKITFQAHGNNPLLPLRFYSSLRGAIEHDLLVVRVSDFRELLDRLEGR